MNRNQLKAHEVESASQPGKLYDGNGLHLLIRDNGSKYWIHRYMSSGRRHDLGLGSYPEVTLREARKMRDTNKIMLAKGEDPISRRRFVKKANKHRHEYRESIKHLMQLLESTYVQWRTLRRLPAIPMEEQDEESISLDDFLTLADFRIMKERFNAISQVR